MTEEGADYSAHLVLRPLLGVQQLVDHALPGLMMLAFGFAASFLESMPIIGLFFSISNRVGAAMWYDFFHPFADLSSHAHSSHVLSARSLLQHTAIATLPGDIADIQGIRPGKTAAPLPPRHPQAPPSQHGRYLGHGQYPRCRSGYTGGGKED